MEPAPINNNIHALYHDTNHIVIGPPPGIAEEDCGSIEALIGKVDGGPFDGATNIRVYWKPNAEDLERLNAGHEIEVQYIADVLIPHTVGVL